MATGVPYHHTPMISALNALKERVRARHRGLTNHFVIRTYDYC